MQSLLEPKTSGDVDGRRKKVLLVSVSLSEGGAERFVSTLLCHLDRDRFAPELCLMRDKITYDVPDDVPFTILEKHKPWHIPRAIRKLRQTIASTRPDVIISNMMFTNWVTGAALMRCPHQPSWIAQFVNNPYQNYGFVFRLVMRPIVRRMLGRAKLCLANSDALAQLVRLYFGFNESRVEVAYNPVDLSLIQARASDPADRQNVTGEPIILCIGRLSQQKRLDVLVQAFLLVRRQVPARLWICGDGPLRKDLERQIARLGLSDHVDLLGFQQNPFARARQASAFVLTSDYEGMPNALIEAQAMGLPAVSTNCPTGPNEIIEDGETGYLVPVGDVEAIANRLIVLLRDEKLWQRMSERARERAARMFDVHEVIPQWEQTILRYPEEALECVR